MIWGRLKSMNCPQCNSALQAEPGGYKCTKAVWSNGEKCSFFITKKKFDTVIVSLYAPKRFAPPLPRDNAEELNNLDLGSRRSAFEQMPSRGED